MLSSLSKNFKNSSLYRKEDQVKPKHSQLDPDKYEDDKGVMVESLPALQDELQDERATILTKDGNPLLSVKPVYSNLQEDVEPAARESTILDTSLHTICSQDSIHLEDLCLLNQKKMVQSLEASVEELSFRPSIMGTCELEDLPLMRKRDMEEDSIQEETSKSSVVGTMGHLSSEENPPTMVPDAKQQQDSELANTLQDTTPRQMQSPSPTIRSRFGWGVLLLVILIGCLSFTLHEKVASMFSQEGATRVPEEASRDAGRLVTKFGVFKTASNLTDDKMETHGLFPFPSKMKEVHWILVRNTTKAQPLAFHEAELVSPFLGSTPPWASLGIIWQVVVLLALWIRYAGMSTPSTKGKTEGLVCKKEARSCTKATSPRTGDQFAKYDLSTYRNRSVVELRQLLRKRGCPSLADSKNRLVLRLAAVYQAELESLTVVQLRRKLKGKGLKQGGLKKDLIQRLVEVGL